MAASRLISRRGRVSRVDAYRESGQLFRRELHVVFRNLHRPREKTRPDSIFYCICGGSNRQLSINRVPSIVTATAASVGPVISATGWRLSGSTRAR